MTGATWTVIGVVAIAAILFAVSAIRAAAKADERMRIANEVRRKQENMAKVRAPDSADDTVDRLSGGGF